MPFLTLRTLTKAEVSEVRDNSLLIAPSPANLQAGPGQAEHNVENARIISIRDRGEARSETIPVCPVKPTYSDCAQNFIIAHSLFQAQKMSQPLFKL